MKYAFYCDINKKQENLIKLIIELHSEENKNIVSVSEIFIRLDDFDLVDFDAGTRGLWENIKKVAILLGRKPPLTFCQLVKVSCLTNSEARRCVKILIDNGGQVEVTGRYGGKEPVFILHN